MINYDQVINTLLYSAFQIEEFQKMVEEFEAAHGKKSRIILEDKLEKVARDVLAYYFGE